MILGTVSRCQQQRMRSVIKVVSQMPCKKCTLQHDGKLFSSHIQRLPIDLTIDQSSQPFTIIFRSFRCLLKHGVLERQISIRHELREAWQLCRAPVEHCHWTARQIGVGQAPSTPDGGPRPQGQAPSIPGCWQAASTPGGEAAQIQTVVGGGAAWPLKSPGQQHFSSCRSVNWSTRLPRLHEPQAAPQCKGHMQWCALGTWLRPRSEGCQWEGVDTTVQSDSSSRVRAASPGGGVAGGLDPEVVVWHKGEIEATFLQNIHQAKSNWPSCCCPIVIGKSQVLL